MRHLLLISSALCIAVTLAGCGSPEQPDGFALAFQMSNVSPTAIDQFRVTFRPRTDMGPAAFADMEPVSYEDGAVVVDSDMGDLVVTIDGDYVRSHIVNDDAVNPRFVLEVWSDDEAMRQGPQVNASVVRMGESIANGTGFLPDWPLALGETTQVNVPCGPAFTAQCTGM